MDMSKYLTVILTTSPIKSHPSTEIIDKTIKSFDYINGLNSCKKFIICDGYAIIENNRYKSGKITEECASHYKEYINSITNKFCNTTIIKRDKRYGFAENVKYALTFVRAEPTSRLKCKKVELSLVSDCRSAAKKIKKLNN